MKYKTYAWKEFLKDTIKLVSILKSIKKEFKNIYGIPRGGLIVAVRLSHLLDLPVITNVEEITKDTLLVDDVVFQGTTLKKYYDFLGFKPFTASLMCDVKHANPEPQFFARRINNKAIWYILPWETKKSTKRLRKEERKE